MDQLRIDKWLWAARFYKTRNLAAQAVAAGQIRWGKTQERIKPSKALQIGDSLLIRKDQLTWSITIAALSEQRGSAQCAALLYNEPAHSKQQREQAIAQRKAAALSAPAYKGRPTKRDRRKLLRIFESEV